VKVRLLVPPRLTSTVRLSPHPLPVSVGCGRIVTVIDGWTCLH
jgi:hypothetical protein